jgi:hypothetical protein
MSFDRRSRIAIAAACAALAGCHHSGPAVAPGPAAGLTVGTEFVASNDSSTWILRGRLHGHWRLAGSSLEVVLEDGTFLADKPADRFTLAPLIATTSGTTWNISLRGPVTDIGQVSLGRPVPVSGRTMTIALPPGFRPESKWLVFEFGGNDRGEIFSTFVCAGPTTLAGAPLPSLCRD